MKGRKLLLGCGGLVLLCMVSCVLLYFTVFNTKKWQVQLWVGTTENPDQLMNFQALCEGSQAEAYTRQLAAAYPGEMQNDVRDYFEEGDTIRAKGIVADSDFEAIFAFGDEPGFLGIGGNCIETITVITGPTF